MINYKCDLVNELDKILPTYYEMFVDSSIKSPCITYIEMDNSAEQEGDTIAYSSLSYRIKIWADSLSELTQYAEQLDSVMRSLGFKRTSKNELWYNSKGQFIFNYRALALENI